jgi:DNA replication protein DnaC
MTTTDDLKNMLKTLNMHNTASQLEEVLSTSSGKSLSYEKFLEKICQNEIEGRESKRFESRLKAASFHEKKTLEEFDLAEQQSLSERQMNQLKELTWLEQGYNLILLGPPGVGKTHLSVGLGIHAIQNGYKVFFTSMSDMIYLLKTQEISSTSRNKVKRMIDADLLIMDDLMFIAMDKNEANLLFQLINKLQGQTSIIITSNRSPEDWGELLGDPAITTAILDRIAHKCELINLCGQSYRLKHRQTIFRNIG